MQLALPFSRVYTHCMRLILSSFISRLCLLLVLPMAQAHAQVPAQEPSQEPAIEKPAQTVPPTAATSSPAVNFDAEPRYLPLLNKAQVDGEIIELRQNGELFQGIYTRDSGGESKGALLILHRHQGEPGWAEIRAGLQTSLAERGWSSLSITLPTLANPATDSERLSLLGRIRMAQEYLMQQGQMNIALLCYRTDCLYASWYMGQMHSDQKNAIEPLQAWILLDAENFPADKNIATATTTTKAAESTKGQPDNQPTDPLLVELRKPPLKVLDLTLGENFRQQQQVRKKQVRQAKWSGWQFTALPATPPGTVSTTPRIANRIQAWLDKSIKGRAVNANVGKKI
jgi:hypothetical protein